MICVCNPKNHQSYYNEHEQDPLEAYLYDCLNFEVL